MTRQLLPAVLVQILVGNAVNAGAGALNDGSLLISLLSGGKDIDLQGLLIRRVAEEGQRLLLAVSVQILQLHGLDVAAGDGGRVLRPALQQLVE